MSSEPIAHQATCLAVSGRGVLVEGPPGSGKSALALALIERGAGLVGDDSVLLCPDPDGGLRARPHPRTRGLLEVRNLGLIAMPVVDEVAIALLVTLDEAAPRFVETAAVAVRAGITLAQVSLWPGPADELARKVALAMTTFAPDP